MKKLNIYILLLLIFFTTACKKDNNLHKDRILALNPPMGWNSFDAYDCRINEEEFIDNVDYLADSLKKFGWEYAVIDYIWFNPEPGNWSNPNRRFGHPDLRLDSNNLPIDTLAMDLYGRLLPAVERFPSAKNGKGFKPLADYVHSKGLKFGIHIMRGIPRQAVKEKLLIKGTNVTADMIAEQYDTCGWCNNMFGIDYSKKGSQEYYNSIFELYAQWEVDFIKADDMMAPEYHSGEIEMIRNAIDNCGRPMVLSLSCGEAPISKAEHLVKNANLWRISIDFWDEWPKIRHMFDLLNVWSNYSGPNHWADADMLPIGKLSLNGRPHGEERLSNLTISEQKTIMNLWCIAKSPLIMGGDLISSPKESLDLLKNKSIIEVNQIGENSRQVYRDFSNTKSVWLSEIPNTDNFYLGLFNISDDINFVKFFYDWENLRNDYEVIDLWSGQSVGVFSVEFGLELKPHESGLFKLIKQ